MSPNSPLYDDDDRTPAEMGLVPFSPRFYETEDEVDGSGAGIPEGFHRMPDGTVMADSEHLVGSGYLVV